jgi:hypothetical protein
MSAAPDRPKQARTPSGGSDATQWGAWGAVLPAAPGRPKQARAPSGGSEPHAVGSVGAS